MTRSLYERLTRRYAPQRFSRDRREMLRATLAASAGLLLSGCAFTARRPRSAGQRVVVVGGGFAGLACAHELAAAGYSVTLFEATGKIGGRVLSLNKALGTEFVPGRNVEGGAELIGSNHPAWVRYAEMFRLEWLDVSEDEGALTPVVMDGRLLDYAQGAKVWEELDEAHARLNADAGAVDADEPWNSPRAAALDARSLRDWIDAQDLPARAKKALHLEMSANNGVESQRQSYLGNLASIKGGGIEKYWTDSEVYRCKGGNQQLAFRLAEPIKDRITTGLPVTRIEPRGEGMAVTCRDGRTVECDDVVLAVAPSVWGKIDIRPGLPASLRPQMGCNTKFLSHVRGRFWKERRLSQYALSDGDVCLTWDATDAQEGDGPACLTVFAGGDAAERARARSADARAASYARELDVLLPGYTDSRVATRFMDWPGFQWVGASYSFPAPGQVTTVGPALRRGMGRLHFAGEHTCYKFVGYMEGALSSGVELAKRLAVRDGIVKAQAEEDPPAGGANRAQARTGGTPVPPGRSD